MRSLHNPEPIVNLGDDPDPASEIGPRLATASQTVQGLLANYLFYGQRRSAQRDQVQSQTGTTARTQDRLDQLNGGSASERTAQDVRSRRAQATRGAGGEREERGGQSVHPSGTRTLRLVEQHPRREKASADSAGYAGPNRDVLAMDPYAEDPLARCTLSLSAAPLPRLP